MDDGEGYLGLDTDPLMGGTPIWKLEPFEAEAVTRSYRALAAKRPAMYGTARTVNLLSVHAEASVIVASRLAMAVQRHLAEGIHFRLARHREQGGLINELPSQ